MYNMIVKLRETALHDERVVASLLNDGTISLRDKETGIVYVVSIKPETENPREKLTMTLVRLKYLIDECYSFADEYPQYDEAKRKRIYWHRINKPEYGIDNKEAFALAREYGINPEFRLTSAIQRENFPSKYAKTHYIVQEGSYDAGK